MSSATLVFCWSRSPDAGEAAGAWVPAPGPALSAALYNQASASCKGVCAWRGEPAGGSRALPPGTMPRNMREGLFIDIQILEGDARGRDLRTSGGQEQPEEAD